MIHVWHKKVKLVLKGRNAMLNALIGWERGYEVDCKLFRISCLRSVSLYISLKFIFTQGVTFLSGPAIEQRGVQENRAVLTDKLLAAVLPCCSGEQWENSSCALLSAGLWTWFSVGLLVRDRVEMKTERVRQEGAGTCDTVCLLLVLSHLLVWQSGMFHFHSTTLKGNKIWDCGCVSAQG